ncbi:hypothetical protein IMSAG049_00806 [Clostridiales bacterium]|nr:hypothetical protein IMSAG049_00806 [Clostridiales bacterium]
MKYNKLTDLAIFVLIAAAVFQTGKLWLGNTESHDFFYSLYSSRGQEIHETDRSFYIIKPEKIIVGYGNRKFNMIYSDNSSSSITRLCESVIGDVFRSGEFDSVSKITWGDYIEGKAVIMKYPFYVSSREYILGYGISNTAFSDNVKSINYIVIVPGSGISEDTYCYFIDSSTLEAYRFILSGAESSTALYNAIQNMQYSGERKIDYISTVQSGMNIFESNYVPQWPEGEHNYNAIKITSPFMTEKGEFNEQKLVECTNNFFGNYVAGDVVSNGSGVYTLSSDNIVVKYYDNGILEYYNYDIGATNAEQALSSAYTISETFIEKDKFILNDIYLSGVETRNDGLVFYYDYVVDNIPIRFSAEIAEKTDMSHAIEVVVSNNSVKRYKRYIAQFEEDKETMAKINVDMISAWDDAIMNYTGSDEVTSVSDMFIGYYLDGSEYAFINWFTIVNGATIVGETYK